MWLWSNICEQPIIKIVSKEKLNSRWQHWEQPLWLQISLKSCDKWDFARILNNLASRSIILMFVPCSSSQLALPYEHTDGHNSCLGPMGYDET
jgi:hypothetical protein